MQVAYQQLDKLALDAKKVQISIESNKAMMQRQVSEKDSHKLVLNKGGSVSICRCSYISFVSRKPCRESDSERYRKWSPVHLGCPDEIDACEK